MYSRNGPTRPKFGPRPRLITSRLSEVLTPARGLGRHVLLVKPRAIAAFGRTPRGGSPTSCFFLHRVLPRFSRGGATGGAMPMGGGGGGVAFPEVLLVEEVGRRHSGGGRPRRRRRRRGCAHARGWAGRAGRLLRHARRVRAGSSFAGLFAAPAAARGRRGGYFAAPAAACAPRATARPDGLDFAGPAGR